MTSKYTKLYDSNYAVSCVGIAHTMPFFSIITPVFDPPESVLEETIESVLCQTWESWQWVIVDDCSTNPVILKRLRNLAEREPRVTLVVRQKNGGIVDATNDGLSAAEGVYTAFLDHDDLLASVALERMAQAISESPKADVVYSDENKVSTTGEYYDPFKKPIWSPNRLLCHMYMNHLTVIRTSLVRDVGGFRKERNLAQDFDIALRCTERAREVKHVPEILYHWRALPGSWAASGNAKPESVLMTPKVVQDALGQREISGVAHAFGPPGTVRITRECHANPSLAIIITSNGEMERHWGSRVNPVVECMKSVHCCSMSAGIEYIVVVNDNVSGSFRKEIEGFSNEHDTKVGIQLIEVKAGWKRTRKMNAAALTALSDNLLFINESREAVNRSFLPQIISCLDDKRIGAVGCKHITQTFKIVDAGLAVKADPLPKVLLPYAGFCADDFGPFNILCVDREVSALSGNCFAISRQLFNSVGGWNEDYDVLASSVDLSQKIRSKGQNLLWLASAGTYQFDCQNESYGITSDELSKLHETWDFPKWDPYIPEA